MIVLMIECIYLCIPIGSQEIHRYFVVPNNVQPFSKFLSMGDRQLQKGEFINFCSSFHSNIFNVIVETDKFKPNIVLRNIEPDRCRIGDLLKLNL